MFAFSIKANTFLIMEQSDINNLSNSILEEVEEFITKANKIKKDNNNFQKRY